MTNLSRLQDALKERLRRCERRLRELQQVARTGLWELDLKQSRLWWSDEVYAIFGLDPTRFGASYEAFLQCVHPEDRACVDEAYHRHLETRQPYEIDHRILLPDGELRWVHERCESEFDEHGNPLRSIGTVQDITERKRLEEELAVAAIAFYHCPLGIIITDKKGRILKVNQAFCDITGYSEEEAIGKTPRLLRSGKHDAQFYRSLWDALHKHGRWEGEIWDRRKDGEIYPQWETIIAIAEKGEVEGYIAYLTDISKKKLNEQYIHRLAYFDALTNLPNRLLFLDRLQQAIQQARRFGQKVAILFLDLAEFNRINDFLGHAKADLLLLMVAGALKRSLKAGDTLARIGGDEFAAILYGVSQGDVSTAVERMLDVFRRPFDVGGKKVDLACNIGISLHPDDAQASRELLMQADLALQRAKKKGRNQYAFFAPEMAKKLEERMRLVEDLKAALASKDQQLVLYYQPQVDLRAGRVVGVEALLRWRHPERGMIMPDHFIPLAEESGLIDEIGLWAFKEACRQQVEWKMGGISLRVAVNLSIHQLVDEELLARFQETMKTYGVEGECLKLELTESSLMHDTERTMKLLQGFKRLGIRIAMDDFGTGYSSLAYLKRFDIDELKIDRSFITGLPDDETDAEITRAIIAMARSLGIAVVAEGVETEAQRIFLLEEGCDEAQGYLFAKPMPSERLASAIIGNAWEAFF